MNQGMLMESMNLAAAWNLPVLFVCKDDSWAITSQSENLTGGDLAERARGLGLQAVEVDGREVSEVWEACRLAIERLRSGQGPVFLHARCVHFEGHFLGYQLIRLVRDPLREFPPIAIPLTRAFLHPGGATFEERLAGLRQVLRAVLATLRNPRRDPANDPLRRARSALQPDEAHLQELENQARGYVNKVLEAALMEAPL